MIERHFFRDRLLKTFDFEFGYCIPHSKNTCEHVYEFPRLADELGKRNLFINRTWPLSTVKEYNFNGFSLLISMYICVRAIQWAKWYQIHSKHDPIHFISLMIALWCTTKLTMHMMVVWLNPFRWTVHNINNQCSTIINADMEYSHLYIQYTYKKEDILQSKQISNGYWEVNKLFRYMNQGEAISTARQRRWHKCLVRQRESSTNSGHSIFTE